jgi:lipoyl(octanoyl) transferase
LGKSGHEENVLISDEERQSKGIEYFHINRGGDITFHGPQQIVGYPILDLDKFKTDLGWYLRSLGRNHHSHHGGIWTERREEQG